MNKDMFRIMFSLAKDQPWLIEKNNILEFLLFEECKNEESRELIIELISKFEFIDFERYQNLMREISLEIVTEPNLYEQSTLIAAMSVGSDADSGQSIIYSLKPLLQEQNWSKHKLINDALHACKTFNKNAQLRDIIIVDEFLGSGRTAIGRVKTIKSQFNNSNIVDYSIKVKVIAATEQGIKNLESEGIDITSKIIIKKGITDHNDEYYRDKKKEIMLQLESILSSEFNGRSLPTMGYGNAEALYYRKDINIPNSVFPIFWWAEYNNKSRRKTLLTRAMSDA